VRAAARPRLASPVAREWGGGSGRDAGRLGGGASLAHFPEGALCSPHKRTLSSRGPDVVADADWDRVDRGALRAELRAVARLAGELRLWVAVGGIAFTPGRYRPTNSLFVISNRGAIVGCYDERMLSRTKSLYMYEAGTRPLVFEVGGVRFGCALGMESQYPEVFAVYEREDVDCVLLSTAGNPEFPGVFAVEAAGHAAARHAQALAVDIAALPAAATAGFPHGPCRGARHDDSTDQDEPGQEGEADADRAVCLAVVDQG
jgi:hypothetical protein